MLFPSVVLGVSFPFWSLGNLFCCEHRWRVILSQDVEPASPAAVAGLQPYTDYIVGSDQILQEVGCMFLQAVIVFVPAMFML